VSTETASACECTHEPPHRFLITQRARLGAGVLVGLQRVDEPYPRRDLFVTDREIRMGQDNVYKACFVCVDGGFRETAIVLPKSDIELGLPPA
jgi:hypothetical protein